MDNLPPVIGLEIKLEPPSQQIREDLRKPLEDADLSSFKHDAGLHVRCQRVAPGQMIKPCFMLMHAPQRHL